MEGAKTGLRQSDSGKDPQKQKYDPFVEYKSHFLKKREKRRKKSLQRGSLMKTSAAPTNEDGASAPNEDVRFAH